MSGEIPPLSLKRKLPKLEMNKRNLDKRVEKGTNKLAKKKGKELLIHNLLPFPSLSPIDISLYIISPNSG